MKQIDVKAVGAEMIQKDFELTNTQVTHMKLFRLNSERLGNPA